MKEVGIKLKVGASGLENIDKLTSELDAAGVNTTALSKQAEALAAELKRLGQQQALIDSFKRQKQALAEAEAAMGAAKAKAAELGREIGATEAPTKKQQAAFAKARTAAREAGDAYGAQRLELQTLRVGMTAAGVSTEGLAAAQTKVKAELAQTQQGLRATADWAQRMATAERSAATAADILGKESVGTAGALRQTAAAAQQVVNPLESVGNTLRGVASIGVAGILGSQTAQMLRSVAETADGFANLQSRIKLVTGEGAPFTEAMAGIADIALRTNSNLETSGGLFSRIAAAGKEIGVGQKEALALTESINQAVQLSGASATASDAAITQLVQGLQGGVLRGDEFNSVMEQAPRLATALANGLGVTTGELRKMAEAGELSAETVIRAIQSQSATLQKEFGTLPQTVGRALENLNTKWTLFVGNLNSGTGATVSVAAGINALADNLGSLAEMATRAGAVLVAALAVQGVGALRSLALQMATTGGAAALLSKNLNDIPKFINIAVAAVGFEVGFQIGQMLHENSALARKLGVGVTEFFVGLVNDLQFVAEAAKAIFTDDTIGAAFDRYKQRAEEQRAIFAELYADAEKSPEVVRAAAAAAAETGKLGDTATAAGVKVAAAGAAGAAGIGATTTAAASASGAMAGLAAAATTAGRAGGMLEVSAAKQSEALVKVALAGGKAAEALRTELPSAIAKLSGPELEAFRVTMTQALAQAQGDARRLADELGNVGPKAAAAVGRAEQAARLLQQVLVDVGTQAAQSLGVDVAAASDRVSAGFKSAEGNLSLLVRSLPALAKAGVDTGAVVGQALAKMIDGAKNQAELDAIIDRVQALGSAGEISAGQVAGAFDLANDKLEKLRQAAEDATPGIQSIGEAARQAGVDVELLTTGVRKGFADTVQPVRDLVTEVIKAGTEASRASPVLADALNKRIEAAQTREELALVTTELERARAAGKLFGGDAVDALDKVKRKAEELSPALQQAQRDATLLGITLRDNIAQGANAGVEGSLAAYERLKAGGKVSTDEIGQAFANLANRAIRESGGIVPEWVKVEASIRGATIETGRTGEAFVRSRNLADSQIGGIAGIWDGVTAASRRAEDAALRYGSALQSTKYDADKFALNGNGTRFTAGGQLTPPDSSGDWEFVGDVRTSNLSAPSGTVAVPGQGYWKRKDIVQSFEGGSSGNGTKAGTPLLGGGGTRPVGTGSANRSGGSGSGSGSGTYTVNINMGGNQAVVNTATAADGQRLVDFLKQLETSARNAGG